MSGACAAFFCFLFRFVFFFFFSFVGFLFVVFFALLCVAFALFAAAHAPAPLSPRHFEGFRPDDERRHRKLRGVFEVKRVP